MRNRFLSGVAAGVILAVTASGAFLPANSVAAQARQQAFDIAAQDLAGALEAFGRQSGRAVIFDRRTVSGHRSSRVRGAYEPEDALRLLLVGTGLSVRLANPNTFVVERVVSIGPVADDPATQLGEIVVTGTRIRGATTPSPVIEITEDDIRNAGFTDLGQVIRSIPQNFSGGQNPGVALGSGGTAGGNSNATSGSSLNLRGLGADASLTVLNGRRLSYNGFIQAVDISVIPVGMVSRIEIVPDGASAIYGSDAVAGVANIILKRDFDGFDTTFGVAIPTNGGGEQYQFSATGGKTWGSGGFIAGYEYTDLEPIFSDQRDYTAYMPDPALIYPSRRQHSVVVSGHQDISERLTFLVDGLYTHRYAENLFYTLPTGRPFQSSESEIYTIAPSLEFALAGDWTATIGGTYGRDETHNLSRRTSLAGELQSESRSCYCNTSYSAEFDVEGPVYALPGGDLRLAAGAGYRGNEAEEGSQTSYYAFSELYAPFVGPDNGVPFIDRLSATAALRYEDYGEIGDIVTPRLGVIYGPTPDFSVKGSWGRSFKTPTLLQQFQELSVVLQPAAVLGGMGLPADATVISTSGGNPDLKPEQAETWSATLSLHPRWAQGLRVDVTAFDVDYEDRVRRPIVFRQRTLSDPAYAPFVTLNPSADLQAGVIAAAPTGLTNATTAPYDPGKVFAIAYNQYTNVARSTARGVDVTASYRFDLAGGDAGVAGSASWLEGTQQNISGEPVIETAGVIYNPAEFRARGGLDWTRGALTLAGFVNHVGGVSNNLRTPAEDTGSFTTFDGTVRYRPEGADSILSGLELALSVQNITDEEPPLIIPQADYLVNYDSTNYSAIGRVVSLTVRKRW